jgi:hypothetical protein
MSVTTNEKEPKVVREVAELDVDAMLEALGVAAPSADSREMLIVAYMDGRITFDAASEEGTYKLARPIRLENGEMVPSIKFREPNGAELQYINIGQRVEVNAESKTGFMDLGLAAKGTIRYLTKVSGLALGVAERMKARDLAVVEAIAGFFQ